MHNKLMVKKLNIRNICYLNWFDFESFAVQTTNNVTKALNFENLLEFEIVQIPLSAP